MALPYANVSIPQQAVPLTQKSGDTMRIEWYNPIAQGSMVNVLKPRTFASLATPPAIPLAVVSDSTTATWGAIISGGGALPVLAFWNGSHWTVAGA